MPIHQNVLIFPLIHYLSFGRFRFKSGNLEHPGDIIRNASVEVLPVSALAQAHKMPGLIYNFNIIMTRAMMNSPTFCYFQFIYCLSLIQY